LRVTGGGFISGAIDNITLFADATNSSTYTVIAENVYGGSNSIKATAMCAGP
jgi:hypothetical protein